MAENNKGSRIFSLKFSTWFKKHPNDNILIIVEYNIVFLTNEKLNDIIPLNATLNTSNPQNKSSK